MGATLVICQMVKVKDIDIFEFLDNPLHEEDEPTDLDAEAGDFCITLIKDKYLNEDDNVNPMEINGFNELKANIRSYLYLKRHNPKKYKELEEYNYY